MHDGPSGGEATHGGCVVLTRRGSTLSPDLLASCVRRGWQPDVSDDPYAVMADLCLAMRRDGRACRQELVLDGVADRCTDQLVLAAHTIVPGVSIWRHDNGTMRLLYEPPATGAAPSADGPPPIPPASETAHEGGEPSAAGEPTRVTADEIALLFAESSGAGS